jgi:hypothetical protein
MIIHERRWKIIYGPWLWAGAATGGANGMAVQEAIFLNRSACVKAIGFELHLARHLAASPGGTSDAGMRYKVTTSLPCISEQVCVSLPSRRATAIKNH